MDRIKRLAACLSLSWLAWCGLLMAAPLPVRFQVEPQSLRRDVPRIGLNLGGWTSWGASQYPLNLLKNPGFEGTLDRAIVIVEHADWRGFTDDTGWTRRPDGFWQGARYEVRSGPKAGAQGVLCDSRAQGRNGKPEFLFCADPPTLEPGAVVSLTRVNDLDLPGFWWYPGRLVDQFSIEARDRAPGSPGIRSLALRPTGQQPAALISYLDTISDRAGKLLPLQGRWRLSVWAKLAEPGASLRVKLWRFGNPKAFVEETLPLSGEWQHVVRDFQPQDIGPPGTLELSFTVSGAHGKVLLDDASLGPALDSTAPGFRPEVVAALRKLRPGYLRDWQNQLGETLDNLS